MTLNTFYTCESYVSLARLPFAEKIRELQRPETRARILSASADPDPTIVLGRMAREFDHMFPLGDPPDYEQPFEHSIASRAERLGVTPEIARDLPSGGPRLVQRADGYRATIVRWSRA